MNKIEEIFKAWNIAFNPDDTQASLAAKRIEICNSCEHKKTDLGINRCAVCGCALKGKVFSPVEGACPEGKWNTVDREVMYFKHCIDVHKESLPENDYDFLVVIFLDKNGAGLYRKDADTDEIKRLLEIEGEWLKIWRSYAGPVPDKWLVQPHSVSKGWCDRIEGNLR